MFLDARCAQIHSKSVRTQTHTKVEQKKIYIHIFTADYFTQLAHFYAWPHQESLVQAR